MALTIKLYDLGTNLLADISGIALERTLIRQLNQARSFVIQAPAGDTLLTSVAGDGYPNLRRGNRKLIVWESSAPTQPIFHGRVFSTEYNGDGKQNLVTITAFDPFMELGFDADDRAGRVVRGSTNQPTAGTPFGTYDGNFINPLFASSTAAQAEITGPDLILQVLTNSANVGTESDPSPGEGPLPIDLTTGTFDLVSPPAVDLNPTETMSWPILVGDFINQLTSTGVVDFDLRPVDPTEAISIADPYLMVAASAVSSFGADLSATVHFDYFTGVNNASGCRLLQDFSTINNKLYDYLGPPVPNSTTRWTGNITPGTAGTTIDPTASRALYGGPGSDKGQFMQIRFFDTVGTAMAARPMYIALWNAEQGYRVEPRDLLYITPAPVGSSLPTTFDAPTDLDAGDIIAINTGTQFGVALADVQRVMGYTKTWDRQDVARLSQLLTTADVSLG